jgi:carboxypeptidase C (cathepsin A)
MPDKEDGKAEPEKKPLAEEPKVETRHEIVVGEQTLKYVVTTGRMPVFDDKQEIEGQIFFTYYALETDDPTRPLTVAFNGGPGSSSVWLHLGALGPKLAPLNRDGSLPPPPYKLLDNPETWLTDTDLVFIDPIGTGFSRAKDEETAKKFYGVEGDIKCLGDFIRLFLTRYKRWASPLFLAGESYGTTRAAGISGYLIEHGVAFNGIILISTVLSFQTLRFTPGNDLPFVLYLPSYTATAWYHGQLSPELQACELPELLAEARNFALGAYSSALMQGDLLDARSRTEIVARVAALTGLDATYIDRSDLRIEHWRFCKELMRDEAKTVGRLDSRLTGREGKNAAETPDFDPSMATIRPPYTAAFNAYVRGDLQYESDLPYNILGGLSSAWNWGSQNGFAETGTALAEAMAKNPHLRVLVTCGYFDLATPFAAAEYTFAHLGLDPSIRANVEFTYYPSGHMMYIESGSLTQLKNDVIAFMNRSLY